MATPGMAYGERRFEAAYTVRIAVGLLVLGVIVGLWAAQNDSRSASHPAMLWVSIGLVAAFAALWIAMGKSALTVNDAGVRTESVFGQQEIAWSQITHTRYRVVPINVYAHFGLVGALLAMSSKSGRAQLSLELLSDDGKTLKVTSSFRKSTEAIGMILGRILPPMVQSAKIKLQRGETVQFGGVGLSATAVTWKNNSIPLSEITKAEIVGTNLQIKRQGKWRAAIGVRSDKVPDVLVFLEVLESLAPQVKASGIDPLARVRV
jgi:Bacterial PH domain